MGFFKNLEIELQDIHDPRLREIVEWDHMHRHALSDEARWLIMTDEQMMDAALKAWRGGPKPASEHVALQVSEVLRCDLHKRKRLSQYVTGWLLIGIALVGAALVGSVALLVGAL